MRKGNSGAKKMEKKTEKRLMRIVANTSLPAVDHPNDTARTTTTGTPHARAKNKDEFWNVKANHDKVTTQSNWGPELRIASVWLSLGQLLRIRLCESIVLSFIFFRKYQSQWDNSFHLMSLNVFLQRSFMVILVWSKWTKMLNQNFFFKSGSYLVEIRE